MAAVAMAAMLPGVERAPDTAAPAAALRRQPPLIAHVIDSPGGGVGNALAHLTDTAPAGAYRHVIVCLAGGAAAPARLSHAGVDVICLPARAGWPGVRQFFSLYRMFRRLKPDLVHTHDRGGLPAVLAAALAGVRQRVHSERGGDPAGRAGDSPTRHLLRKLLRPLIAQYIVTSSALKHWLIDCIGVAPARVSAIGNGVDSLHFHPRLGPAAAVGPPGFLRPDAFVIGSVGRMDAGKDHLTLVKAFLRLLDDAEQADTRLRLLIAGDGPCREACLALLRGAGKLHLAWLPGARDDIAQLLRAMDLFVLPALADGGATSVLEAMASGLPVVACAVGANAELVQAGWTGTLVPPGAPELLAGAISDYAQLPGLAKRHGLRGRRQVLAEHSVATMTEAYRQVYDKLLAGGR